MPDVEAVADKLRPCLQEPEPLPRDFSRLLNTALFSLDTSLVPDAVEAFRECGVEHKPLTLIPPHFDAPLPPLTPAIFPPAFREPPPPALEFFDLDEAFASERTRLAQLAGKCSDADVDFFVKEAALILGITPRLAPGATDPKDALEYVLRTVAALKCISVEEPLAVPPTPSGKGVGGVGGGGGASAGLSANAPTRSSQQKTVGAAGLSSRSAAGFRSK